MGFKFMTFDPYLTFAEGERGFLEKIFLKTDGIPTATWHHWGHDGRGYLSSLWSSGRDAYAIVADRLGKQPTAEDFKDINENTGEIEKSWLPYIQRSIDEGRIVLNDYDGSPLTSVELAEEGEPNGWLLGIVEKFITPGVISGDIAADRTFDFEALFSAAGIMYIDGYIIAKQLDTTDMDEFLHPAQACFSSAKLYRKTVDASKEAVSAMGRRSASVRHKPTNQLKAAALAMWDVRGDSYSGMAAFARHHHKEYEVTERTLYNWVREHRNAKS